MSSFTKKQSRNSLGKMIWKNRSIYLLFIPALIWYLIFAYMPMGGLSLAFKEYKANLGIWGSPFIGLEKFRYLFKDQAFWDALKLTFIINGGRLLIEFPAPIILALLFNELRLGKSKKRMSSILTFPHFLSWIIVASIFTNLLSYDGLVNNVLLRLTGDTINFLGNPSSFIPLLYATSIWKSAGYGSIIYASSIAAIDQQQYEAAEIDGASRWQRLFRVTLPNIAPTIIVMFVLTTGTLLVTGFDQIFNLSNAAVLDVSETLDMYIYRVTFQSAADFSYSTAISLFRSLVNMILLLLANLVSKRIGGVGLFGGRD